ncbi:MAG: hypothetical protein QOH30_2822 [Baekduia sp.]|nr:hypothetical protein [Baekduia sp.]
MSICDPISPEALAAQSVLAGALEAVVAGGRDWLAGPGGRHGSHAATDFAVSLCLVVGQGGEPFADRLAELRALGGPDAQIVVAVAASAADWTFARALRSASEDLRVAVYHGASELTHDQLAAGALALSAAPLAVLVPAGARIDVALLEVLTEALDAAPAATAAVAGAIEQRPGAPAVTLEPWCGVGPASGTTAAIAALATPLADLVRHPAVVRTAALAAVSPASLRDLFVALCAHGDTLGLAQPLVVLTGAGAEGLDDATPADAVTAAIRTADVVREQLPERRALAAAARALAAALASAAELPPPVLAAAGGALRRVALAPVRPRAVDTDHFAPGVQPLPLGVREHAFLCRFPWSAQPPAGLDALVEAYVSTFAADAPASLVLCPEGDAPAAEVESWLVGLLTERLGRTLEEIPDVALETGARGDATLPALHAVASWAVLLPGTDRRVALEALACGVPLVAAAEPRLDGLVSEATAISVSGSDLGSALAAAVALAPGERRRLAGRARAAALRAAG